MRIVKKIVIGLSIQLTLLLVLGTVAWNGLQSLKNAASMEGVIAAQADDDSTEGLKERLAKLGSEPTDIVTSEQFGDYIKMELAKWEKVIKSSGMRIE